MLNKQQGSNYFTIYFSFVLAMMFIILPVPKAYTWAQPEWIILLIIYWAIYAPHVVGVATGFIVGVLIDLLCGHLLGVTGLCLSILIFLCDLCRHRFKLLPLWQQIFIVSIFVAIARLIKLWIFTLLGYFPCMSYYWMTAIISAMLWPVLHTMLHSFRGVAKVC